MPQCWYFNRNRKLYPEVSAHGNPLSEFEASFHLNIKKQAITSVVWHKTWEIQPLLPTCHSDLWKKVHLCFSIFLLRDVRRTAVQDIVTRVKELAQQKLQAFGEKSAYLGKKKLHKCVLDNNTGKLQRKEKLI